MQPKEDANEVVLGEMPLTLRPSKLKWSIMTFGMLLFTAIGVWMVTSGERWGYVIALLFGLISVVGLLQLFSGKAYLRLDWDSFTFVSLFRTNTVRWADVAEFGVMQVQYNRMVAWSFAPGVKPDSKLRQVNRAIAGFDAAVPDTYGLKAEVLALTMEALRERYWTEHGLSLPVADSTFAVAPQSDNAKWAGK